MAVGTVTGLSSGIDSNELVSLMMELERRPVDLLEERRYTLETQITTWKSIEAKVIAFESEAQSLDSIDEFLKSLGTSSDTDVLTVTANATAAVGNHEVVVNQLATAAVHAHETGWADKDTTAVNSSGSNKSFSYDYAGTTVTVTVADGTTLQGLIDLINKDTNNPGVTASIINDGTGGGSDYHLVMLGNETGSGNDITIIDTGGNPTDIGPTGAEFDEAGWDTTQAAQNAELQVDGIPDGSWSFSWIESASNDVADIIPGITLHLQNTSGGNPIQVEVSLDQAAIKSSVQTLVDAYNDVIKNLNNATRYDPEEEVAGVLNSDSLARSLRSQLMAIVANNIPGTTSSDTYRSLGQVGISMTAGGVLKFDKSELADALDDDATGVARLFAFDGTSTSSYVSVYGHGSDTVGGAYNFTVSYDASGNLDPSGTNSLGGFDAIVHGDTLLGGATDTDVEGLQLEFLDPGDGPNSISGSVQIYTGFSVIASNLIDDLTDSIDGSFKIRRDGIDNSIDSLDDKIEAWESRLESIEEFYNQQFSSMEILIGQLQTQGNFLSAAL